MTMVVLHLFVVAKPETGYDALAMHLQAPLLIAEAHKWPFDVTRYVWAVMPMGADWAYTAAYLVGGEGAARFLNFCFGALACYLLYELIRLYARRDVALASVCLAASTPIAFLETGTLYVENLWLAFLLGTLLLALDYLRTSSKNALIALAFLAAGALQCKVIGVIWLAPLLAYVAYLVSRRRSLREFTAADTALLAVAAAIAAWPYVNAWLRTGNPCIPLHERRVPVLLVRDCNIIQQSHVQRAAATVECVRACLVKRSVYRRDRWCRWVAVAPAVSVDSPGFHAPASARAMALSPLLPPRSL